eukprot:TRINITY_DN1075_c0_g1_i2.p1 TRINITY_DN1075_c0_g1~~TRINITY_DN1075_c0_g1_i2.p1  ORF type:complete len:500 (+),score=148.85 TRINITY_DN1075_c0_g1_i2:707-2206(+)
MALPWMAYCAFNLGDFKKAMSIYKDLIKDGGDNAQTYHLYLACCMFYLGMYKEAEEEALKGTAGPLQNRLLFHLAHKFNDETKLMSYHSRLQDTVEDQLSLASIHHLRSHYQEATDIYKRMLLENRDYLALNVYIALCYYKLDYYDVSLEVLQVYLSQFPTGCVGINLKACNHYKLYNGKAAESELKVLADACGVPVNEIPNDLIKHNLVVFNNGENALRVLPPLVDVVPEARLNLAVYHLRNFEYREAYNLMAEVEPTTPQEYILKGVVNAALGQQTDSQQLLKNAQQYFNLVGASASECDTIPGRQCMASCFFLAKQFHECLIYLQSIEAYFASDETFQYNYGIARAAEGQYAAAEDNLLNVTSDRLKNEYSYIAWLARCFIMNGKPRDAWNLYLRMETSGESFNILQLIANDCYKMGQFFVSAKAFDVLERLDPNPEYLEGKKGACVGVFQMIVAGKESRENLREVIALLRNTSNPQVEYIIKIIKKWAKENGVRV